jgi:diguanylate cyclase (GGDEF)-like protein
VTDPSDQPNEPSAPEGPTRRDASREGRPKARRQRRFSISEPEDHRLSRRLEAFLEGPAPKSAALPASEVAPPPEAPARPATSRPPISISSRADWNEALRYEDARHERYGRSAAVAVVDLVVFDASGREASRSAIDMAAALVGRVLRSSMRLPDRIARVGPTRFHLLLPETNRVDARRFAERARRAAEAALIGGAVQVTLRIAIAVPARNESLPAALATAELQLGS